MGNNNDVNIENLNKIKMNMISALNQMITETSNFIDNYPISKNQNKFQQYKYFTAKILSEIKKAMISNDFKLTIPFLRLSSDPIDQINPIDKDKLINFFSNEIRILHQLVVKTHSDIPDYFSEFNKRLNLLAEE